MKKSYLFYLSIVAIVNVITSETSASGHNNFINSATFQQIESRNSLNIAPLPKSIQVSQKNPPKATRISRIEQGMPYRKARKILIQQGWQPNLSAANGDPNLDNSQIKVLYDSGYKEIKDCSGTGLGLCRFEFINSKGELLAVSATSLPELNVFHWFLDPPPQAIQVSQKSLPLSTKVTGIQQGMPYRKARKILIQQGWQPNIPISTGDLLNLENNSQVKLIYDRGYDEVKDCSGTGLGLCRFEFINYKRELLVVSATSQAELRVFHWLIQKSEYDSIYR